MDIYASVSIILLVVLLIPIVYYVRHDARRKINAAPVVISVILLMGVPILWFVFAVISIFSGIIWDDIIYITYSIVSVEIGLIMGSAYAEKYSKRSVIQESYKEE